MKYPNFLKENDTLGIPAPSSAADSLDEKKKNKYNHAIQEWQRQGYRLILSDHLFQCEKGRSASAKERAEEINNMFQNKDIQGIICASGGDFLIEILPFIDFQQIQKKPKWIAGFSDPTGLLYPITTKYDIATIYGNNFSSLGMNPIHQSQKDFLELLKGNQIEFNSYDLYENEYQEKVTGIEGYHLTEKVYWETLDQKEVKLKGRIIGGCFDIIAELAGTKYDGIDQFNQKYQKDGIIWYFDNCELSMEETIRVLWKMKELGYFQFAKGIIFGRFGVEKTFYDYTVKTCLEDSVLKDLSIPVIYNADISHKSPCIPIINGCIAEIHCKNGKASMKYSLE